jgi:protein-tyrosine phosphatase
MDLVLVGAFKVKDGLFIGDEFAAQDLEFVVANKVTRIVNCAARQVPNHWEPIGVQYLSFAWFDVENQVILDTGDKAITLIYNFIDSCLDNGESVLVHSVRGVSRCVCVVTAFLMKKYGWSIYKSLDFLAFRRPDIDINPGFLHQLGTFENRLSRVSKVPRTDQWDKITENPEEVVLRNTYLNARLVSAEDQETHENPEKEKETFIRWQEKIDLENSKAKNRLDSGFAFIKSCLKGSQKYEKKVPLFSFGNRDKNSYVRVSFSRDEKPRSSSLCKGENKLVREAISAARGTEGSRTKNSSREEKKDELFVKVRPTTAAPRRPPSPKIDPRSKVATVKGQSFTNLKKKR